MRVGTSSDNVMAMTDTETNEVKRLTDTIEGWLTDKEGKYLYNLAKSCAGRGVIVEIGSWKGKSTIWLGTGSKKGGRIKIYAVDPHTGFPEHKNDHASVSTFPEFQRNLRNARVDDIVIPIVQTSAKAAKNFQYPVELIFIDGAHEYDLVRSDFDHWFPKVVNGGMMVFDDTTSAHWHGPKKVVEELVYKSRKFRNVRLVHKMTVAEKVEQNSAWDRIKNRKALLMKHMYERASGVPLPKPIKMIGDRMMDTVQ